jgi:hypothetical protein
LSNVAGVATLATLRPWIIGVQSNVANVADCATLRNPCVYGQRRNVANVAQRIELCLLSVFQIFPERHLDCWRGIHQQRIQRIIKPSCGQVPRKAFVQKVCPTCPPVPL